MNRQPWQRFEMDLLIEQAETKSASEIAKALGRTPDAVRCKANYFGLQLVTIHNMKAWQPDEIALFHTHTDKEISHITGRTLKSIACKRLAMKIYRRAA